MPNSEQELFDSVVDGSIETYVDNKVKVLRDRAFMYCNNLTTLKLNKLERIITSDMIATPFTTMNKLYSMELPSLRTWTNSTVYPFGSDLYNFRELILSGDLYPSGYRSYKPLRGTAFEDHHGIVYVKDEYLSNYREDTTRYANVRFEPLSMYPITNTDFGNITDSIDDIIESENDGTYLSKYSIGDTKTFYFNGEMHEFEIIGFDKDEITGGEELAHITWMSCIPALRTTSKFYDPEDKVANIITYKNSSLYKKVNAFIETADENLLANIKTVSKSYIYFCSYPSTRTTNRMNCKAFIPSLRELGITDSYIEASGCVYSDYFVSDSSRKRYKLGLQSTNGDGISYWTRTIGNSGQRYFIRDDYGTAISATTDSTANYVFVCFCT